MSILLLICPSRSREGAWIEIVYWSFRFIAQARRSREGAWIEMTSPALFRRSIIGRSREGAWIEIHTAIEAYGDGP